MHDSTLLRGALFISLTGIIALYFLQNHLQPPLETSNEWNEQTTDRTVRTRGMIEKSWVKNNQTHLTLNQTCLIQATLPKEIELPNGVLVEITGKYNEYRAKREIRAETLRTIE